MPKRALQTSAGRNLRHSDPTSVFVDRLLGKSEEDIEKEDFTRGIKSRREMQEFRRTGRHPSHDPYSLPFDPVTTELSMPAALMTRYVDKKSGAILKSVRELGTQAYEAIARNLPPELKEHALEFAKRYPRIAAHIHPGVATPTERPWSRGWTGLGERHKDFETMNPVRVKRTSAGGTPYSSKDIRKTTFHEGTHVAQDLGLGEDAGPLWNAVRRGLKEIYPNDAAKIGMHDPFEGGAMIAAERKVGDLMDVPKMPGGERYTLMRKAEQIMKSLPSNSPARTEIFTILNRRRSKPMMPSVNP